MGTIQPNGNITLAELQERVKYILGFKPNLEKLLDDDPQQAVKIATSLHEFINSEDKELSKARYDQLMLDNNYLSNYRVFVGKFRQFLGRLRRTIYIALFLKLLLLIVQLN